MSDLIISIGLACGAILGYIGISDVIECIKQKNDPSFIGVVLVIVCSAFSTVGFIIHVCR